ncbi:MAG: ATP-binding cassette domain-containing protein [Candidatus Marinimicrobia bacterium]|nr:ATP-binding cassette domain-containing protein [Candidatus Neomarinimicrobiota bacterium]
MQNQSLFQFTDVAYEAGGNKILSGVSFEVQKGEFLAVLGASGAGKSSLLRMFNSLASPTWGQINFRGQDIDNDIQCLRKNVGILFQNPVVFSGSVKENLLVAGRWDQTIAQTIDHDLSNALEQVEMGNIKLTHNAKDLSGGEQQRLALARTLLNHPQVLLLDEPTSNLDPKLSRSIMDLVNRLRKTLNLTVIAVSHNHQLMRRYAQRVIVLSQGKIVGNGSFKALDQATIFEKAGLLESGADDET